MLEGVTRKDLENAAIDPKEIMRKLRAAFLHFGISHATGAGGRKQG